MINGIEIVFNNGFKGKLKTPRTEVEIGSIQGALAPYDMLFAALGSCMYATVLDIARKKRASFHNARVLVSGEKRTRAPGTLEVVYVTFEIYGADNKEGIKKAVELAKKYCSVYHTIGAVAEIDCQVFFYES